MEASNGNEHAAPGEEDDTARLRIAHVRGLVSVLQAIKSGSKQTCTVNLSSDGMRVKWEDDSKSLQGSLTLKPEFFVECACPAEPHTFGLPLQLLLDTLAVMANAGGNLGLAFPGPNSELVCEMADASLGPVIHTYARVNSVEVPSTRDLADGWQEPASYFLIKGAQMKEAIDDLEWPNSDVELRMKRDPQQLSLVGYGQAGSLEVEIPTGELSGFQCAEAAVSHSYKYKALKAAFCNLPSPKEVGNVTTKVSIDSNGILKAMHMLSMPTAVGHLPARIEASSLLESQRALESSRSAVVQFVMLPTLEDGGAR